MTSNLTEEIHAIALQFYTYLTKYLNFQRNIISISLKVLHLVVTQCFTWLCKWRCLEDVHNHFKKSIVIVSVFWSFLSHSRIFHSFGDVTIIGKGLQNLTYARHLWQLSSEGSLACHTYCDLQGPVTLTSNAERLAVELSLPVRSCGSRRIQLSPFHCTTYWSQKV